MRAFMDEDFMLHTETARKLYHSFAEGMPVLDYHCHISPGEIACDRKFENITQVWLGGDHYKWRLMRANGWRSGISLAMPRIGKNFRNGPKRWRWRWGIRCITGAIWNCSGFSDITEC